MKKLVFNIDASLFTSRKAAHEAMKEVFKKYEYYGNNLDALHDVLTSIRRDAVINISGLEKSRENIDTYVDSLMRVFNDCEEENEHLTFVFTEE